MVRHIFYAVLILFVVQNTSQATTASITKVTSEDVVVRSDVIAKGSVSKVIWNGEGVVDRCFSFIYKFVVDDVFKGDIERGDELILGANFTAERIQTGQNQVVFVQKVKSEFFETCNIKSLPSENEISEIMVFPSTVAALYQIFGGSMMQYRVTKCHKYKRFVFGEKKYSSPDDMIDSNCITAVGEYQELKSSIFRAMRSIQMHSK